MPKLCENGCSEYVVGRVIIVDGPKMIKYHLCSKCRRTMLRKKDAKDYPAVQHAHNHGGSSENLE